MERSPGGGRLEEPILSDKILGKYPGLRDTILINCMEVEVCSIALEQGG